MRKQLHHLLALCTAASVGSAAMAQNEQPSKPDLKKWNHCQITSPSHSGRCEYTWISTGGNTTNIHFLLGALNSRGLAFVFLGEDAGQATQRSFVAVVEEFNSYKASQSSGKCILTPYRISCTSQDGRFSANASGASLSQTAPRQKVYADQAYKWRITYPGDWRVEQRGHTEFTPESKEAMCGVHVITRRPPVSTNQLTDEMLGASARYLQSENGIMSKVLSRRTVKLLSGEIANDVLVDLVPGGRSRRLFVVSRKGLGYLIDCETYASKWQQYEHVFESVFKSFSLD